jgi:hypothetical protein
VRGDPKGQGAYVSIENINTLSAAFEIRSDELSIPERDSSMDKFTYHEWCLLAPHGYSELFAFNRKSQKVRMKSGEDVPVARFLKEHFLFNKYIDCGVDHNPRSLLKPKVSPSELYPSESSIRLSDDSELRFIPKRNKILASAPTTLNEKQVSEWVNDTTRERRNKRTFSAANRQDIKADNGDECEGFGVDIPAARIIDGKFPRKL